MIRKRTSILISAAVALLIGAAMLIRFMTKEGHGFPAAGVVRSLIYIGLITAWGVSVKKRIIQAQVRFHLTVVAALMVLWLVLRTIKFNFTQSVDAQRLLWYLYYLPMLFIPVAALFISLLLWKPEDYRLPLRVFRLLLPAAALLALVLTNDLHCAVFGFPAGVMSDSEYHYNAGYYVIVAWEALCIAAAFVIMLIKCRIPHGGRYLWLPLVPLALAGAYGAAYIKGVKWVNFVAGDITVTMCLITAWVFECCIHCGLIQSNMGYDVLFEASTIRAHITDRALRIKHSSADAPPLSQEYMKQAVNGALRLDADTLLKCSPTRSGYIFWQEDISELTAVTQQLELTHEELWDTGDVLKAENEQRSRRLRIEEQNRLYDMIEAQTSAQTALLSRLTARLRGAQSTEEARRLLGQIVVVGTYVKRRSNLVFLGSRMTQLPVCELRLCLNESAENLRLYGAECGAQLDMDGELPAERLCEVYDLFEAVVEAGLDSLSAVYVYADSLHTRICAQCGGDMAALAERFRGLREERDEDGVWYVDMTSAEREAAWTQ